MHLHALGLKRRDKRIMLGLHLGNLRHRIALEIPTGLQVAEGADAFDAFLRIDDIHFLAGPVHQHRAHAAHIIVDAPGAAPMGFKLVPVLERRIAGGGEHPDRFVVNPDRRWRNGHHVLPESVILACAGGRWQFPALGDMLWNNFTFGPFRFRIVMSMTAKRRLLCGG